MAFHKILQDLRHELHRNAELSHRELTTQTILRSFLSPFNPTDVIPLADSKALLFGFDSGRPGPHVLFRADMDALPIAEKNESAHSSRNPGTSHACGHDGHMTLVASLADAWQRLPLKKGKLGLLFQHAEELGEGAREICQDPIFKAWKPSSVFGLHNIPGAPLGEVILGRTIFACASTGLRFDFRGVSSHAAEPSKARSALAVVPKLLQLAQNLNSSTYDETFFLATPVHVQIGGENYGITPGHGRLSFTLRSISNRVLESGLTALIEGAKELSEKEGLGLTIEQIEPFPALSIDTSMTTLVEEAAEASGLAHRYLDFPFLWSEDFGYFTESYPGTYFGVGMGTDRPGLHDPSYDFNDEALIPYAKLMESILIKIFL